MIRTILLLALLQANLAYAETRVTTYITKVQEERRSTRWTLTEWLRIKERMKMMDVWLAMFSQPSKDKFSPELNLVYFRSRSVMDYESFNQSLDESGDLSGTQARVQLYLTNLFTGSTGLRLLNVDFGLEGGFRDNSNYEPQVSSATSSAASITPLNDRSVASRYYAGLFRLFGKNIQDSSLALRVGQYHSRNTIAADATGQNPKTMRSGLLSGLELQLYLFRWLGLEGNAIRFHKSRDDQESWNVQGHYYDYFAYIEVSFVRLMVGQFAEEWRLSDGEFNYRTREKGVLAGVKMQL